MIEERGEKLDKLLRSGRVLNIYSDHTDKEIASIDDA
jgi:hypothetical protein